MSTEATEKPKSLHSLDTILRVQAAAKGSRNGLARRSLAARKFGMNKWGGGGGIDDHKSTRPSEESTGTRGGRQQRSIQST